ncbi:MAG: DNA alkylation repair protein [Planctomycetes bacterium]|nr:DNA alkylation repair protein [Planctomycetota bacterium]
MAEPFKNLIDGQLVRVAAKHLRRAWPEFPGQKFVRRAITGLEERELKARVTHVADALAACLPATFARAAGVLERSLAPARDDTDLSQLVPSEHGLAGWVVWPMTDWVARYGLGHPARALRALHAMTQRNTAEYAIRRFVLEHRERTMATLRDWVQDRSAHVRRLVSEGTRPRLPWGVRLGPFVEEPSPCLPLLERLQDDPSDYVRRSVANHLNDISKDHPDVVVDWLQRHLPDASPERRAMLRHAARTLIKQRDKRALRAFGQGSPLRGRATLAIEPGVVRVGDGVQVRAELVSTARTAQGLVVDYVVHHVRKNGDSRAKTWKGWQLQLGAGERRALDKRHSLRPVTTRRDYPGVHRVELVVNGDVVAASQFELRA